MNFLLILVKSAGYCQLLFAYFFLNPLSSFFKIKYLLIMSDEFCVTCFELENTFDEIICFMDEGLLDSGYLGKSIVNENRSRFNISLNLKIVSDLFISSLGNFQESSYCKKVIHMHLVNDFKKGILFESIFRNVLVEFLCFVSYFLSLQ